MRFSIESLKGLITPTRFIYKIKSQCFMKADRDLITVTLFQNFELIPIYNNSRSPKFMQPSWNCFGCILGEEGSAVSSRGTWRSGFTLPPQLSFSLPFYYVPGCHIVLD